MPTGDDDDRDPCEWPTAPPIAIDSELGFPLSADGPAADVAPAAQPTPPVATTASLTQARARRALINANTQVALGALPILKGQDHEDALAALKLLQGIVTRLGGT